MGVTGLWTVVQPCARPIKIETLNKKRLAIDASIWIYQFLKAVRDKEGNALRNSHVVGFFRRICKLLFFGIKPIFVFDGGAPLLKRETIGGRKARREGRREDAVRTAGKLLGVQMRRLAEEETRSRREERDRGGRRVAEEGEEEIAEENLVYVDELQMTAQERTQNRTFRKKDAYHLPLLDVSLADMGAPNDPRVMSHEELEEYARQFHTGEDVNLYDFNKIDFNGPFFQSLPASDRYNILNAARLRSRLRMGYSKEQLDTMFPDRMAFSRFQIERVAERNELTQRLMNINGMNGEGAMFGVNNGGRVAGEKGREYVLVKNDGVEGGWALGVVSNKGEGGRNKPIDVEGFGQEPLTQEDEDEGLEDDGFEDVPIEGLNRLPKGIPGAPAPDYDDVFESEEIIKQRRTLYEARQNAASGKGLETNPATDDGDSLFVQQEAEDIDESENDLFEDVISPDTDEDDDLDRAIAMSLEQPEESTLADDLASAPRTDYLGPRIDQPLAFNQKNAKIGRDVAHSWNARASSTAGAAPKPFPDSREMEYDANLRAALDESRRTMHKSKGRAPSSSRNSPEANPATMLPAPNLNPSNMAPPKQGSSKELPRFDGPLPFESLNLGTSMLRKKKPPIDAEAGGFDKQLTTDAQKQPQPLPPWFSGDIHKDNALYKATQGNRDDGEDELERERLTVDRTTLNRQHTGELIAIESSEEDLNEIIEVESSSDEANDDLTMVDSRPINSEFNSGFVKGDVADLIRAENPSSELPPNNVRPGRSPAKERHDLTSFLPHSNSDSEEPVEWEESDIEQDQAKHVSSSKTSKPNGDISQRQASKSISPEFENVAIVDSPTEPQNSTTQPLYNETTTQSPPQGDSLEDQPLEIPPADDEDLYSDPEDEDLLRQLAIEAEEHARFASTLSSKSHVQSAEDYERELRQLRNQQKKDRRDADEVSHIMITECQQLLKLFGLPYITAPMEAEAQCAELVSLGLVDGIVTDDSDIFLFGGTRVYKNMFNQAKFVECYLSADLEREYSLDRQKLISIAHLLGSDYTEGLPSVGPVTALEILSEFETLEEFSDWWSQVQMGQEVSAEEAANPFRRKFRRNASKIFLPAVFPDKRVDHAYLHPEVDSDPSAFAWGVPDLDALRQFLMATIGWTQERTDEVLVPVIKDMNRREDEGTQANITQFFGGGIGAGARQRESGAALAFAPRRKAGGKSKRMESALGRLHDQARNTTIGEGEEADCANTANTADEQTQATDDGDNGDDVNGMAQRTPVTVTKASQKARSKKRAAPHDDSASGSDSTADAEDEAPTKAKKRGKATNTGRRGRKVAKKKP